MLNEEIKKILEKQLQLLSIAATKATNYVGLDTQDEFLRVFFLDVSFLGGAS